MAFCLYQNCRIRTGLQRELPICNQEGKYLLVFWTQVLWSTQQLLLSLATQCLASIAAIITEYYWHVRQCDKQVTLPHFQQIGKAIWVSLVPEDGDMTKPRAAWKCWSLKAFQQTHIFSRCLKDTAPVVVRETILWLWCDLKGGIMHWADKGSDQKWTGTKGDTSEQMERGKLYPCLWTKSCSMNQTVLVCCVLCLCVCTCKMAPRKICLFVLLMEKNTCSPENTQNMSPLRNASRSNRILSILTAHIFESDRSVSPLLPFIADSFQG